MELQSNLFTTLLELQSLIQIYNAHEQVITHKVEKYKIKNIRGAFYMETRKMDICLVNIKLKKQLLGITETVDELLKNKLPFIEGLENCKEYTEFVRTNNLPIEKVNFKVDTKRSCEDAFGKKYCWVRNPTQYV